MFNWLIGSKEIEERDFTIKFELKNNTAHQELNNLPKNYGVYQVFIEPVNDPTAPSAIFNIGRKQGELCGQVSRLLSVKGNNNGQLDMCWPANKFPHLQYRPINYNPTEELIELNKQIQDYKKHNSDINIESLEEKRLELFKNLPKVEYKLRFISV
jgi:hypothetical protein